MGAAAVQAAHAIDYANACTVEFIVAPSGDFFFMEINTRLQVEHPVTEMTLGLDLVELQLRVAAGEALPPLLAAHTGSDASQGGAVPAPRGHAIELRLYAEDPAQDFLPGSGTLERLRLPAPSPHVRIDAGVVEGDTVTIFYDPMIAKLIVHDASREAALVRMREALAACDVVGPKSNIAFLERLVRHPAVVEGRIDTGYLDRHLDEFIDPPSTPDTGALQAAAIAWLLHEEAAVRVAAAASTDPFSPWAAADGWRLGHHGKRLVALQGPGGRVECEAHGAGGTYRLAIGGEACEVAHATRHGEWLCATLDGTARRWCLAIDGDRVLVHDGEHRQLFRHVPAFAWEADTAAGGNQVVAPMPGRIVLVRAAAGDSVEEGAELLVMEAMKMELSLKAPRAGTVESVQAAAGEFVDADSVLVRLAPVA
jgi:3-methylcrotonyl-CoA carboxylase alpha subunit